MNYERLNQAERCLIYALKKAGFKLSKIAAELNRSPPTISREIARNTGGKGYRPAQAQRFAESRQLARVQPRLSGKDWERIEALLKQDLSPEQISLRLKKDKEGIRVSHERIYQHIYEDKNRGGTLYHHLRCKKKYKKRTGSKERRGQIKERVSIEARPTVVDERVRIGDWEADTVIGRPGGAVLVTLVERKSRFTLAGLAPNKTSAAVKQVIIELLKSVQVPVHTITYDNGKEFAGHLEISKSLGW